MKNIFIQKMVALVAIAFILMGCTTSNENNNLMATPIPEDDRLEIVSAEDIGYSFGVLGPYDVNGEIEEVDILIDEENNMLRVLFENHSGESFEFTLKFFLNYEEAMFRVLGEDDYVSDYVFSLSGGYGVEIPFSLKDLILEGDHRHRLTAAIFLDPNRQIVDEENHWDRFGGSWGMVLNFDLVVGAGGDILIENHITNYPEASVEHTGFPGLRINQRFEGFDGIEYLPPPDYSLQVRRGEPIELTFYSTPQAGNIYELENYLIMGLLDWQQVAINDQPYFWLEIEDDHEFDQRSDFGRFTLDAIDEVGEYDLIFFMIPNPQDPLSWYNSRPHEISHRILLEVVD